MSELKYSAVIFDLYGTLVDVFSRSEYERVLAEMSGALGVPHEEFARAWLVDTVDARAKGEFPSVQACIELILRQLDRSVTPDRIQDAIRVRMDFVSDSLCPRPETLPTLRALKDAGCKTGLVSNCSLEMPRLWPQTELAPLIDAAVLSSAVGLRKPDPAIYRLVCERLAVASRDCLYVGDGDDGELEGAAAVGLHPVLIRAPYDNDLDAFRRYSVDWPGDRVSSLKELLPLILE